MSNPAVAKQPSAGSRDWMCHYLAKKLGVSPDQVDTKKTFDSFGLDSAEAVRMVGDLEDFVGRRLSPSLPYKYPTIEALSQHLDAGKS
ncbi:acyl carrier protein [Stigmatella sp. ncwal1]|uniref:Acyl carrier protein n=1 Tax=Stigmatella ashevillensis TaxID=2995309 RepID=A0ABT5D3Q0_9BACT|nr:acyl carrier protein [Stigmatella ashevillena]MDC0708304.1 acyl carrier protein [Stigmatella ashevillena]